MPSRSPAAISAPGSASSSCTVALHYVFDTPRDRLIWDVGHQAYPHKILTGRRDRIRTLRTGRRPVRLHQARRERIRSVRRRAFLDLDLRRRSAWRSRATSQGSKNNVIAVIGDGAMSAGMAYEAMNNAGAMNSRLIVILNDNDMSIAPPVGAMSAYLARRVSGKTYRALRDVGEQVAKRLPTQHARAARDGGRGICPRLHVDRRHAVRGTRLLLCRPDRRPQPRPPAAGAARTSATSETGPILVHVVTQKGKGYAPAEASADKYHGVVKFDVATGAQAKAEAERAGLSEGVRREPGQGSAQGRQDRRHHRGDAVGHRRRHVRARNFPTAPSTSASPSSMR